MPKPRDLPAEGHKNGAPRGTTPTYGLPYPADTDPADVPQDLRELADRLELVMLAKLLADAKGDLIAASGPDAFGRLAVGTDGQALVADAASPLGVKWAAAAGGGGGELAYAQITAPVTITATTEATGQTVVAAPAVTLDGATAIIVEFGSPQGATPASASQLVVTLWDGATSLGTLAQIGQSGTIAVYVPLSNKRRLTPGAGSHTYAIKAWLSGTGSGSVGAGTGAPGAHSPAFIRVSRA